MIELPNHQLIPALDVADRQAAERLLEQLTGLVSTVKIGLRLFCAEGPDVVRAVVDRGFSVFLDLKLHDIPNTVGTAAAEVRKLGVSMLTVHASGGPRMVAAAAEACGDDVAILGVTVLTSLGDDEQDRVFGSEVGEKRVISWASLALEAGARGIVCSPHEASAVAPLFGQRPPLIVTPGVRPAGTAAGDQARVATPASALAAGATHLVVGRPIYLADDPRAGVQAILREITP